ncbi:hypothetical protein OBA47_01700 [bacterium]|nr:hypothetical protein [bacterium]
MAIRFPIQQVGNQFAVGEQQYPVEQRQNVWQCVRVWPVSGSKNSSDLRDVGGDH